MAWDGPVSLVDLLKDEAGEDIDYGKKAEVWGCNTTAELLDGWKQMKGVHLLLEVLCPETRGSEGLNIAKPISLRNDTRKTDGLSLVQVTSWLVLLGTHS